MSRVTPSIFLTRRIPEAGIVMLREKGYDIHINESDVAPSKRKLIRLLKKHPYDVVLTLLTDRIDGEVFDAVPTAKLFANYATGFDNIDITQAAQRSITVTNAPAPLSAEAVAEHTIALMLSLAARIVEADESIRRGRYKGWSPTHFIGTDVLGKTLGIIGGGRIGARVAHYARGLGMKITYTDLARNETLEKETGAMFVDSIDALLPRADIVSIHVPLLDSTRHLINGARLKLMKPTSFLINTSRGPVIDEAALIDALQRKAIAGAGLDVFEHEPKVPRALRKLQNVVLTPHIASASIAARDQMAEVAANNIIDFLEGRVPRNIVTTRV